MGSLTNPASFVLLCKHGKPVTTSIRGLESPQSEEDAILCDCSLDLANPGSYLFYLKRAKLRLGQEKWVKASKDLKAIETKVPESERIAYQLMRVQALLGMECHAEAKNILDSLHPPDVSFSLGPVPKRSGSLLETEIDKRRKVMERQGIAGEYELNSYLAVGVEERPTELQCSEYAQFFTIEYNPDQDRTSRGVYACKWLQPGKLVLASTAIVMVKESPAYGKISISMDPYSVSGFPGALSPWQEEIITKLVPRMQECPKVARQMLSLQDWPSRGTSRAEMPVAHSGGETTQPHRSKPDLSLLSSFCTPAVEEDCREPSEYASNGVAIDINRLRRIVAINSFRKPGSGESGGIWTIPSFFNHSCTPNCSWHIVGDTMFISASKKLVPRDQLKLSYFNVASTWFFRKENAERLMFSCNCARCSFEEKVLKDVPDLYSLSKRYYGRFESLGKDSDPIADEFSIELEEAKEFVTKLENILVQQPCQKLTELEKSWIRSGFAESYKVLYAACSTACQKVADMSLNTWVNMVFEKTQCASPRDILIHVFKVTRILCSKGFTDKRLENLVQRVCTRVYVPLGSKDLKTIEKWVLS